MMLRKLIYTGILSVFITSCGGSDDLPPEEELNQLPTIPELLFPTDNLLCIDNVIDFQWGVATDPNGDAITYQIEVSKDRQFSTIAHTASINGTSQTFTLEKGLAYYWRVKAYDAQSTESLYTPPFGFYTESEALINHLPFSPILINPALDTTLQANIVNLEWDASDVDGDPLTYDVYFGTENPPNELISKNQSETTFQVNTVSNTDYFWKVNVKDDDDGQTLGQVWKFSTN